MLSGQGVGAWPVGGKKAGSSMHYKSTNAGGATGKSYVVRSGDTLSAIATKNHLAGGWHTLCQLNRSAITDPNLIYRVSGSLSEPIGPVRSPSPRGGRTPVRPATAGNRF